MKTGVVNKALMEIDASIGEISGWWWYKQSYTKVLVFKFILNGTLSDVEWRICMW